MDKMCYRVIICNIDQMIDFSKPGCSSLKNINCNVDVVVEVTWIRLLYFKLWERFVKENFHLCLMCVKDKEKSFNKEQMSKLCLEEKR